MKRWRWKTIVSVAALAYAPTALACAAVPTLVFESADASIDAVAEGAESGVEDGAAVSDGGGLEGGGEAGCGGSAPPLNPYVCCGSVACEGQCADECDACAIKCTTPGDVCCARTNSVTCMTAGSVCH